LDFKKEEYKLGKCRLSNIYIYIYIYAHTHIYDNPRKVKVLHLTKYDLFLSRNEI